MLLSHFIRAACGVWLLALAAGVTCGQSNPPARSEDRRQAAEELLAVGRVGEALEAYRQAVELATNAEQRRAARFAYALALAGAGRDAEAAAQYEAAIQENGGRDAIAYFNLGNIHARAGANEKAVPAYRRAIEQRFGHYAKAANNLGLVLARLGRLDEAREAYQQAIAEERGYFADAHYNLARLLLRSGEVKLASEHLARARQIDPKHDDAARLLAQVAGGFNPELPETIVPGSALDQDRVALAGTVSPATLRLIQQAREARGRGQLDRAADLYQAALRSEGRDIEPVQWELAQVWSSLEKWREAADFYRKLIARTGDRYPLAYYQLGVAMMKEGKAAGAVVMLRQAASRLGEQPYVYLALSEAYERNDDIPGALEALHRYARLRAPGKDEQAEQEWYRRRLTSLQDKQATNK